MQEPSGHRLPEKRKLLFQEDMLMDFPDLNSLQTSFQTSEEKHFQWLQNLEEQHKIQRTRLRNRHIAEYQKWKNDTKLSIDPEVILPYNSTTGPGGLKEQFHETSLQVLSSQAATEALKRHGKEYRNVLVGMEQLDDPREEGEILGPQKDGKGSGYSNVELAAELGRMGANLRKAMVAEKIEMRLFQASEKEMVQNFLLKSDSEKYGAKGRMRGQGSLSGPSGTGGAPGSSGIPSRPSQGMGQLGLAQENVGIGGAGLAGLYRQNNPEDKFKSKGGPPNIKIPPPATTIPGPRSLGTGNRTATSTPTTAGDGYFSGLSSAGSRDPRLAQGKTAEPPKDPRLALNSPTLYRNAAMAVSSEGSGEGITGSVATTASNTAGKPPNPSASSFHPITPQSIPPRPPSPAGPHHVTTTPMSTAKPSEQMPPPSKGIIPVTAVSTAATESATKQAVPLVPGMSPVTPTLPPSQTPSQTPGVPPKEVVLPQVAGQNGSMGDTQTQGSVPMDISQG